MYKNNMFEPPCRIPPGAIVLIKVWTYVIKQLGKRNSRNNCDGSPLTGKVFQYYKKYSACASQHVFNIFISLFTALGYIITASDDINTYVQAPPPDDHYIYM